VLIANPIPAEHALDKAVVDAAIATALVEANDKGVKGKALTPFLLKRLDELTDGRSVEANVALAEANCRLGGALAVALAELDPDEKST
jgi:pseudouridine-5'-phosphate glycosidase